MIMENLIDFYDPPSKLHYPSKWFGVIKHKCIAIDVTGPDENSTEVLQPGCLIQLITDYHSDGCYFKMRNFTNWLDKYKTTIYKCSHEDYIMVTMKLWPYLVACENFEYRIKFVQKVYSYEFDIDILKLGSEIKIRRTLGDNVKYYLFIVIHNGVVKEIGPGHYIGLQLKNNYELSLELECFKKYYRFGGTGIIVSAEWIMQNLYNEERYHNSSTIDFLNSLSEKTHPNKSTDLYYSVNEPSEVHGNKNQFHMFDIEFQDLGGESAYNRFVNNDIIDAKGFTQNPLDTQTNIHRNISKNVPELISNQVVERQTWLSKIYFCSICQIVFKSPTTNVDLKCIWCYDAEDDVERT